MKTAVIIDVAIAALLLGFVVVNGKRGLLRALTGLAVVVLALLGAAMLARTLTPPVVKVVQPALEAHMAERVGSALDGAGPVVPVEPSAGSGETASQARELMKLMGLDEALGSRLAETVAGAVQETGMSIIAAITESLLTFLVYNILFALCFAGLALVLKLLLGALGLAVLLPGLHAMNHLGGLLVGAVEGVLLVFLAIWIMRGLGVSFETETVAQTYLLKFFAEHSPLDLLLLR